MRPAERSDPDPDAARRRWLIATGLGALCGTSACGGGGAEDPTAGPQILGFESRGDGPWIAEPAQLLARFEGGVGRIEPGIGAVSSGVPVPTPPLAGPTRYTLVLSAPDGRQLRRELQLQPRYRDRYRSLAWSLPLQYHASVTSSDGELLLIGGSRGTGILSDAVERFDPRSASLQRLGSLQTGRSGHSALALADGRVLVLGGQMGLELGPLAELFDARSGSVSPAGRLAQPRHRHAALVLADGRVLVVGGLNRDSLELWDPATRSFRLLAARLQHAREFPTATLLADGRVLIVGGAHLAARDVPAELFDPRDERLSPVPAPAAVPPRRQLHQAHRLADGRVLVLGGESLDTQGRPQPLDSVLIFDPRSGNLQQAPPLDRPRSLLRSVGLPEDRVLLFGGATADEEPSAEALSYELGGVRPLARLPQARAWHTVDRLADGRLLIVGGDGPGGAAVTSVLLYE